MSENNDSSSVQVFTTGEGEAAVSTDVRRGYLSGPGFADAPVNFSVIEGRAIYDGCIDMGSVEAVEAYAAEIDGGTRGIGLPTDSAFLWPGGVVPFVIDGGLPDPARITNAISHFHQFTGIRFVARTNQANFVRFVSNGDLDFSSSPIGMRGGEQRVRISNGSSVGVVIHECCHSLGVLHEQSRCDRDNFVTINLANVRPDTEDNFDKLCTGFRDYFDYDFGSIMHYGPFSFSVNNQPTITPKQPGVTFGQRNGLSYGDRLTLAEMYRRFDGSVHHGVFRAGNDVQGLWVDATWDSFVAKWNEWAAQGLRLVDVQVKDTSAGLRYSGVWRAGSGGYGLWANATWDSFVTKWREWGAQGLRLVDMHVRRVGNEFRYTGTWTAGNGGYALWGNANWASLVTKWQEFAGQGLRLVDLNTVQAGGQTYYTGVWLPGSGGYGLWGNASRDNFLAKWREWSGQGLRLIDVSTHVVNNQVVWTGVFGAGTDGFALWLDAPWQGFVAKWQQYSTQGLRLIDYETTVAASAADPDHAVTGNGAAQLGRTTGSGEGMLSAAMDDALRAVSARTLEPDDGGAAGEGALVLHPATPSNGSSAPAAGSGQLQGDGGIAGLGDAAGERPFSGNLVGGIDGPGEQAGERPFSGNLVGGIGTPTEQAGERPFSGNLVGGIAGLGDAAGERPFSGNLVGGIDDGAGIGMAVFTVDSGEEDHADSAESPEVELPEPAPAGRS